MTSYTEQTTYTCPVCETTAPAKKRIGPVIVCGHCNQSLIVEPEDYATRRATTADLADLTPVELDELRKARGRTR